MDKIKQLLSTDNILRAAAVIMVLICAAWLAIFVYIKFFKTDNTVVQQSQHQAETPAGVQYDAEKAGTKVDKTQATQISKEIKYIYDTKKEPVYVVQTTGENAKAASSEARKEAKADFAIVTDRNDPDKEVNLDKLEKDQKVELNQYNIQAYKPVLRTVSITPDIQDKGIKQVNFSISKR